MTAHNPQAPAEVLDRFVQEKLKLQKFYDMAVNYFRCKCLDKTNLERRPPVALCLRDPDHVFTIKPGFKQPRKHFHLDGSVTIEEYGQMQFDTIHIDCVSIIEMPPPKGRPILQHQRACKLRLNGAGQLSRSGVWYYRFAPVALHEFISTVNDFILFPWQVFGRSKDNCCCCGKRLTDDSSRAKGIGPECLRNAALCFGEPVK